MRVLLDTNFIIDTVRFRISLDDIADLMGAHDLVTLSSVKKELIKLSKKASKDGGYAKIALEMISKENIKILKSDERPDNALLKMADDTAMVATNDIELRKRLKTLGRKTIYLKSKKHLAMD